MSLARKMFSRKFFFINLVLLGIIIGFSSAFFIFVKAPNAENPAILHAETISPVSSSDAVLHAKAIQDVFNAVASAVLPSVVELDVTGIQTAPAVQDFPWRFFFGEPGDGPENSPAPREYQEKGLGSGIIIRKTGKTVYVLTNNHVVANAKEITVKLHNDKQYNAKLVGADTRRDLAVVSFETDDKDIVPAKLGNSDKLRIGDWAIAIGSPFGLFSSVTTGIISAIGRDGGPDGNISDFIQTDAAINRGNSGGALANIDGEVIGINTWIASNTGGSIGLGFSIPINNALKAIDDIISKGNVSYGWLGVLLSASDKDSLSELGYDQEKGAFVGHVFVDGPADKGGLKPGDFITSIDNKSVASMDQLVRIVGDLPSGAKSSFTVLRANKKEKLEIRIEERKEDSAADYSKLWPGLEVSPLSSGKAASLKLPKGQKGLLVLSVVAKSPASALGLKAGDLITEINDQAVSNVAAFYSKLNDKSIKKFQFTMLRDGQTLSTLALVNK